jgi:RNA polymerase sigma factor (sigma-70 family)
VPVTYPASGPSPAAPAELAALLAAKADLDREQAWAGFVQTFTPPILRVARSLGGDTDTVMDRYAFVLERLREDDCRRLQSYLRPGAGEFTLWLVVVVRRLCLDHYRERYGRTRAAAAGPVPSRAQRRRLVDLVADKTDPTLLAAPDQAGPHEILAQSERMRTLGAAIEGLAPRDRLLLRLRFAEDLPAREIARLMQFPTLFHVYRRLDKVLGELRGVLQRLGMREAEP